MAVHIPLESDRILKVAEWLVNSGIQAENGGYYAWFNSTEARYSFLYSEITGYAITSLLFLNKLFRDEHYLLSAKKAANWIIKNLAGDKQHRVKWLNCW